MRIVGTGHSFTGPGLEPCLLSPALPASSSSLHNGGGRTGSVSYKWEQENGIFEFDGKPLPKLLAAISAEWEAMIWDPITEIARNSMPVGSIFANDTIPA